MPDPNTPLEAIARRAAGEDRPDGDLAPDIAILHKLGWLVACLPRSSGGQGWGSEPAGALPALVALRAIGRANLSVARLFEGHMNAVKLIEAYGSNALRAQIAQRVGEGLLLGVWGADDPACPLRFTFTADGLLLEGAKRFASGLGVVGAALVTAGGRGEPTQLLVVDVDDPARADATGWTMAGMRATRSGRYEFSGVRVSGSRLVGSTGDFEREPLFEGGIWRYCAAHLGGAEALYHAMCETLVARDRAVDPHQQVRVVSAATALETARLWLARCAEEVEASGAGADKANLSLLAREVTANVCRTVLHEVDAALGMAAHVEGTPVERIGRDLSLFLCQAAPDAKRARAAGALIDGCRRIEAL
ncbi:acyl-CoA dehydrogenase family protein [Erythrobacter sp. LQ02-29]|uniref:acyl-CoA dehydrogenase family protein n=1 Tax=Erythrobacter sp. LQ02-29 TaxID=2920384 RepID=UPI001F4D9102|nr:acyl-CoA dehydrogenase family protein [Erythrobacter sp. LQ02-29]MCP9221390.1 acyl-CoA dehydrogenase family protein [Erythrobacter sp. LQ02-29]